MSASKTPEQRRAEREKWPIARYPLGHEPGDDLSETTTASERIAMMWPLAVEAWLLAGNKLPEYQRSEMPCRLFRAGERPASK